MGNICSGNTNTIVEAPYKSGSLNQNAVVVIENLFVDT